MTPLPLILKIILAAVALAAAASDFNRRKIPNWLVAVGIFLGLVFHWKPALYGLGLALAAQLPFFAMKQIGAGDVKLMAAIGALAGPMNWLFVFAVSSVLSGFGALVQIRRSKRTIPRGPFVAIAVLLLLLIT